MRSLNKTEALILSQSSQGPFEFETEWIDAGYRSQGNCIKGWRMYFHSQTLRDQGLIKITEVSRLAGKANVTKWTNTGESIKVKFRIEK